MENILGRHFISLFLILLFAIRLISQRSTRDRNLRYFWMTVISCFLLIVEDQAELMAAEDPALIYWRIFFSVAGYFLRATATLGLVLVVCKPERRSIALWIPCFIDLAVCSTAFFTDIAFGYDADYAFYRGPLGYIVFIVPIFYLMVILWLTFRYYVDKSRKLDQLILLVCAVFCLTSSVLDSLHGGVRLHEAILISSVFFYVFLRSYDVRRDSLTLLLNRQSLYDDCKSLGKEICAVGSLDMNGLKEINENQGYQAGDAALKAVGEILQEAVNANVRAYRISGDEFIMLFFRQDEMVVREMLDRIRKQAEEAGYSLSTGYAMREEKDTPESLMRRADLKMFEQKARYYRDKSHDRRHSSPEEKEDRHTAELKKAVEEQPQPVAVYRFGNHRVETLAVSDGFCRLFGYPDRVQAMYILDHDMYSDDHADDRERVRGAMLRFSEGKDDLDIVYRTRAGVDSGFRVVHARGKHVHTATGERVAYIWYMDEGVYIEGDEEKGTQINQALNRTLHEESILHAAHYDDLTGLPNLAWFFELWEAKKEKCLGEGKPAVFIYINLIGMRFFNHKYGFAEGDRLLKAFAGAMVQIFGKENCCHIAADCFAAGVPEDAAEETVQRLFSDARTINGGKTLPVRAGIYSTAVENVTVSSAFDRAKMACEAISRTDASTFHFYDTELRDTIRKQQYLLENIDRAIEEKWIRVYYQPIVRAVSGKICDEEALARWIDPVAGFLSPADFIPLLEKAGLIYKLDLCVLEQVLDKMKEQQEAGKSPVSHSINLSRSDFEACDIVEEFRKRVDAAGISRDRISVEITESIIGSDFDFMKEQIDRFHALGFPVWMDDFGSGYSSLDVLQSIPFDLIKFDMSFMRKLDEGENGKIILTELMKMATSLRVDTVCEGVETEAQVRFLREIGCSKLQGYYFGKPMPLEQVKEISIGFENPAASAYYETIGRTDLYDLGVIASEEADSFHHSFNTLPMAIIEIKGDSARFVRSTPSYREFILRFFGVDISTMMTDFVKYTAPFMEHVAKACCEQGTRTFFDETMRDGSVVHSFARRISINPLDGSQAVAVAVLSISGAESSADIARARAERDALAHIMALAEDYLCLYSVDPESGRYIEYTTTTDYETLGLDREGDDFFGQSIINGRRTVYEEDLPKFLDGFTKEKVLGSIRETGKFTLNYRLVIQGEPTSVSLKIAPFQSGNEEKLLAGVRRWRQRSQ